MENAKIRLNFNIKGVTPYFVAFLVEITTTISAFLLSALYSSISEQRHLLRAATAFDVQ